MRSLVLFLFHVFLSLQWHARHLGAVDGREVGDPVGARAGQEAELAALPEAHPQEGAVDRHVDGLGQEEALAAVVQVREAW